MQQNLNPGDESGISIRVPVPARNSDLYGPGAVDDVLLFLARHPLECFTAGEMEAWIDYSEMTIRRAVEVLEANDLVEYRPEGNRKPVQINRSRLSAPDDPILRIPQEEYHQPVDAAVEEVTDRLDGVIGIVLYGSVARGEADRRSDVDLWVAVNEDRAPNQRAANRIADELEDRRFGGERYAFHVAVESVDAVPSFTAEVRDIVLGGITLYSTESFRKLRTIVAHGGIDE